jgi:cyanophycin synthetase
MQINRVHGKLFVVGGKVDKQGERTILREFVRDAGGADARIVVVTVATHQPQESGEDYREAFQGLGVNDVRVVDVSDRQDAVRTDALRAVEQATAVFLTGGDHLHVASLLGGTPLHEALQRRHREGFLLGGTSAGAAMMSNLMIVGGDSNSNPRFGAIDTAPGINFVPDTIIDTHFSQRGRLGRLLTAVAHYPQNLGLGIDENTAIVISDSHFEVIGENSVTVADGGGITYTTLADTRQNESLTLHGVRIHVLAGGQQFDLSRRAPIVEESATAEQATTAVVNASAPDKSPRRMRIESIRTLAGPNVYTHQPALIMRLDLGELNEKESYEIPGFVERLLARLPELHEHHCSKGRHGGFVERLHEGTYFGHTVEHVALELASLAGCAATHGKTRYAGEPGIYNVVIEFCAEQATRYLLETAVEFVEALIAGEEFSLAERIEEARRIASETELGPSTRAIVEAAERRGIPWFRENEASLVRLGYGKNLRLIQAAMTDGTSAIGVEIAGDKDFTKARLAKASIPVPEGEIVYTEAEAVAALDRIGAPIVVKPLDGRQGKGVSLHLSTPEEVRDAFRIAREFSREVLVEEMFDGRNYRVLVVGYRMVAASERIPCHVTGDGVHTVGELIEIENQNPLRGEGHEKPLTKIRKDDPILTTFMRKEGWSMEAVPEAGERVMLCAGMNLSTGGTAKDVTEDVHPSVRSLCERAARIMGMDVCGVDLVLNDIAAPHGEGGGIIEINAAPGLRMHQHPGEGRPRDAGQAIVDMLFPAESNGRIPIISITGTNGKTTVTRMISHILIEAKFVTGTTTTDGIYLNGARIVRGDTTGPVSAMTILEDKAVEAAVLETARGGIVRRGLGYDWSDISVITNVGADHIGQDGIESIEDILWIKSLVAERVREGGTLILNADDERLARLSERRAVSRVPKSYVYFSLRPDNPVLLEHCRAGGTGYFYTDGWIMELEGDAAAQAIVEAAAISATMGGTADFQIANALAAVAATRAFGLSREMVGASLARFRSDAENPGRANLYKVGGGYVMVDYGHNPDAFEAVCRMAARWEDRRVTGIIGVPGDRDDSVVEQAGRVAARGFHRVIIKEDKDLRGRAPGEVAKLLCEAVNDEWPGTECRIVLDEVEALRAELQELQQGQVVVIFYDKLEPVLSALEEHGALAVAAIEEKRQALVVSVEATGVSRV